MRGTTLATLARNYYYFGIVYKAFADGYASIGGPHEVQTRASEQ
jgi:hypothetical protein